MFDEEFISCHSIAYEIINREEMHSGPIHCHPSIPAGKGSIRANSMVKLNNA